MFFQLQAIISQERKININIERRQTHTKLFLKHKIQKSSCGQVHIQLCVLYKRMNWYALTYHII